MKARLTDQVLAEIVEECAKALAGLDQLEAKAQRHGFRRDSLKLAKQQVSVLKSEAMEAMRGKP